MAASRNLRLLFYIGLVFGLALTPPLSGRELKAKLAQVLNTPPDVVLPLVAGRPTILQIPFPGSIRADSWIKVCLQGGSCFSLDLSKWSSTISTEAPLSILLPEDWLKEGARELRVSLEEIPGTGRSAEEGQVLLLGSNLMWTRGLDIQFLPVGFEGDSPGPKIRQVDVANHLRNIFPVVYHTGLTYRPWNSVCQLSSNSEFPYEFEKKDEHGKVDGPELIVTLRNCWINTFEELKQPAKKGSKPILFGWIPEESYGWGGLADVKAPWNDGSEKCTVAFGVDKDARQRILAHESGHLVASLEHPRYWEEWMEPTEIPVRPYGDPVDCNCTSDRVCRKLMATGGGLKCSWINAEEFSVLTQALSDPSWKGGCWKSEDSGEKSAEAFLTLRGSAHYQDGRWEGGLRSIFRISSTKASESVSMDGGVLRVLFERQGRAVKVFSWVSVEDFQQLEPNRSFSFLFHVPAADSAVDRVALQGRRYGNDGEWVDIDSLQIPSVDYPPQIEEATLTKEDSYLRLEWSEAARQHGQTEEPRSRYRVSFARVKQGASDGSVFEASDIFSKDWQLIATDLKARKLRIPRSRLPGCHPCLFRVTVSDGYNESSKYFEDANSDPRVDLPDKPLEVFLVSPSVEKEGVHEVLVRSETSVRLVGVGWNPQTGPVDSEYLTWTRCENADDIKRGSEILAAAGDCLILRASAPPDERVIWPGPNGLLELLRVLKARPLFTNRGPDPFRVPDDANSAVNQVTIKVREQ